MSVSREGAPGGGANSTTALAFGGFPLPISATEEWYGNGLLREVISSS